MDEYKPRLRIQLVVLGTLFLLMLPAIYFSSMGYMWFVEYGLKIDPNVRPETISERLFTFLIVLPMVPVLVVSIFVIGIPWMFLMSRFLSWSDIQYFTRLKEPRLPILSDWLDRIWLQMTEYKNPDHLSRKSPQ